MDSKVYGSFKIQEISKELGKRRTESNKEDASLKLSVTLLPGMKFPIKYKREPLQLPRFIKNIEHFHSERKLFHHYPKRCFHEHE